MFNNLRAQLLWIWGRGDFRIKLKDGTVLLFDYVETIWGGFYVLNNSTLPQPRFTAAYKAWTRWRPQVDDFKLYFPVSIMERITVGSMLALHIGILRPEAKLRAALGHTLGGGPIVSTKNRRTQPT